jgi:hypothetical protein
MAIQTLIEESQTMLRGCRDALGGYWWIVWGFGTKTQNCSNILDGGGQENAKTPWREPHFCNRE